MLIVEVSRSGMSPVPPLSVNHALENRVMAEACTGDPTGCSEQNHLLSGLRVTLLPVTYEHG